MLKFFIYAEIIGAIISLIISILILYTGESETYKSEVFWGFLELFFFWQAVLVGGIIFSQLAPELWGI